MRTITMNCPNCGRSLEFTNNQTQTKCLYCGSTVYKDDEKVHTVLDNAEQVGYEFEKGRIKALQEVTYYQNRTYPNNTINQPVVSNSEKTSKTLVIVLLIFMIIAAIVLPILLTNKKNDISNDKSNGKSINNTTSNSVIDNSSKLIIENDVTIDITHSDPYIFTDNLSKEKSTAHFTITAPTSGVYVAELRDTYKDSYFELSVTDKNGNKIHDQLDFDWYGFDLIKGETYTFNVYNGNGKPSFNLWVFPPNESIDISKATVINDTIPVGWMDNHYSYTPSEDGKYDIHIDSKLYLEVYVKDNYDYNVGSTKTAETSTCELKKGITYSIKINSNSKIGDYQFTIRKQK